MKSDVDVQKVFNPVVLSINFESQDEFDTFKALMGELRGACEGYVINMTGYDPDTVRKMAVNIFKTMDYKSEN